MAVGVRLEGGAVSEAYREGRGSPMRLTARQGSGSRRGGIPGGLQ